MGELVPIRRVSGRSEDLSDEALVAATGVGDRVALGALFDRFHLDVWRFLGRVASVPPSDLDDLVQMTFLEIRRSAAFFTGRSQVKTWIFGIAAHVARGHVRGESRRRAAAARLSELPPPIPPPQPDTSAERAQLLDVVARALAELPYDLRVAYVLCVIEELAAREVARELATREGTVWRRVHEARRALRDAIEAIEAIERRQP